MSTQVIIISFALFLLGGLLEIGGGYLVWQWQRGRGTLERTRRRGRADAVVSSA